MNYEIMQQLLDLPRVRIKDIEQREKEILIWVYIPDGQHVCPGCGMIHTKLKILQHYGYRQFAKQIF